MKKQKAQPAPKKMSYDEHDMQVLTDDQRMPGVPMPKIKGGGKGSGGMKKGC